MLKAEQLQRRLPPCFGPRTARLIEAKILVFGMMQRSGLGSEQWEVLRRRYRRLCREVSAAVHSDRRRELARQAAEAEQFWQAVWVCYRAQSMQRGVSHRAQGIWVLGHREQLQGSERSAAARRGCAQAA